MVRGCKVAAEFANNHWWKGKFDEGNPASKIAYIWTKKREADHPVSSGYRKTYFASSRFWAPVFSSGFTVMLTNSSCRWVMLLVVLLVAAPACGQTEGADVIWSERIEIAAGDAHQGPWRMNRSEFHYVDDPTVAMDEAGSVGVVWADHTRRDLFFQRYSPNGEKRFTNPVGVSHSPEVFSWLPRLVLNGRDSENVYVLWQEIVFSGGTHGGEIFFARSSNGGETFHRPVNLSNSLAGDGKGRLTRRYWHNGSLDLALGVGGVLHAAWTEYEGSLLVSRSVDGGNSFSTPMRIAGGTTGTPARGPSVAVHGQKVFVMWTVGEDESADIHFVRSFDGGQSFEPPRVVAETNGHSDSPKVAVDPAGTLHLVFAESPNGFFDRYHIRYMRSDDGGQTFQGLGRIPNPHPQYFKSGSFPSLGVAGNGRVYVLWELYQNRKSRPRGLGFTYSKDGGESFAPPALLPDIANQALGENGSRQGSLMRKLAVNSGGALAVVNSTFRLNDSSHVWLLLGRLRGNECSVSEQVRQLRRNC